ncbi:hypothetical protein QJS10_CPB17g00304 [Acorus calamus]|uniref:Uncharacterized protein n=1 Tax=Acorus calamus TaxID=4465 RepID=A0AAV9CTF2_ACOCL|nr:hypothetical protein QJS10_CPB17g00304 [Acorus calamus]
MDTTCEFCAVDCPAVMQLWNLISVATSSRVRIQNMEDLWTHMVVAPNLGDEAEPKHSTVQIQRNPDELK